jgi:predicted ATP-binding protein involved in virulence
MHPRWQQVLVDRLKEIFPNVQFIASTHSPLIVGGMSKEEVDRFTIRKGKIEKVDFEPDMTLGRTDQILTGELFGLPTTLDATTQKAMERYEVLLGKSKRTPDEDAEVRQLERTIEERIPPTPEQPVERRARELLDALQSMANGSTVDSRVEESMSKLAKALQGEER